jgi:hypothetical protein
VHGQVEDSSQSTRPTVAYGGSRVP